MRHKWYVYVSIKEFNIFYHNYYLHFVLFNVAIIKKMDTNKDILDRALGRPAMMVFIILVGTYVTTGQLIPGIY